MAFTKESAYYENTRNEILPFLPPNVDRVLEVGCAAGYTLDYLKRTGKCRWTCGIELVHEAAEVAKQKVDLLLEGNIETIDLPIQSESIDLVLCLDVLEHLVDPWSTVGKLRRLMKPGGTMIAIVPNVRNVRVVSRLLFGKWEYGDEGILDRTHLRFFTRRSAVDLIRSQGLQVGKVATTNMLRFGRSTVANWMTLSLLRGFLDYEYLITATKTGI
jgi:2-polyprenyl-3-methyl-5-hydroxy-6-metoxy-1,4-benzoquinol methylase